MGGEKQAARTHEASAKKPALTQRGLAHMLASKHIHAKLAVNTPDDAQEREADQVADRVTANMNAAPPAPTSLPKELVQTKCEHCEQEEAELASPKEVQRKASDAQAPDASGVERSLWSSAGGGKPIEPGLRHEMEQRIGADFSSVRVHTGTAAAQMTRELHAYAFTHGANIYFGQGQYDPGSKSGRHLLAHELAHVVQQGASSHSDRIQRQGKDPQFYEYSVKVPESYTTAEQMFRLFERVAYGHEVNHDWTCPSGTCDITKYRGKTVKFLALASNVKSLTDPKAKKEKEGNQQAYDQLPPTKKKQVADEADKRYYETSGEKPGTKIKKGEEGKAQQWNDAVNDVMKDKAALDSLPQEVKDLMGPPADYKPADYQRLLKISEKIKANFSKEDLAVYKMLAIRATSDLDKFEKSVDMFIARKAELTKALEAQQQQQPQGGAQQKKDDLRSRFDEKWKDLDESSIGTMSESDRYDLARQKTSEMTAAQLKYMKDHPGETLKDFAKSATLVNTPETFSAIGKDIQEAASGDANSWARWAAGTGAGAKISGWLLAVAGVIYIASWLTGIGELATIAAFAGYMLAATLTLSLAESELRIKAASQAKDPEEFKRNVELAAQARTNVIVGVALLIIAFALRFIAKTFFPETMKKVGTALKNFREKIRLKGSIYELKPQIKAEMSGLKGEIGKAVEAAKKQATDAAGELEKLTTEQFADKVQKGEIDYIDQSKVPADQRLDFNEMLKTPEGKAAVQGYKARLIQALKTDVVDQIDRLGKEAMSKIDDFLKDIDEAKNHDDMKAAADKVGDALSEEALKKFMAAEQERVTKQKMEEAVGEAQKEALAALKDAIVKRVTARIAGNPDFKLAYSPTELDAIVAKGKQLGLSDRVIEDMIYTGSRIAKAISAADLMQQMDNYVNKVVAQGYPYKFSSLAEFKQFSADLLEGLSKAGMPTDDVRIQGSSLRNPNANDVDIACFIDLSKFDQFLIDRFEGKITKGTVNVPIKGKTHAQLVELANDIATDAGSASKSYNAQARSFMNAVKTGIINSKSDIIKPLKAVQSTLAGKYPQLNIETVSVLIRGGAFELKPDMPVTKP